MIVDFELIATCTFTGEIHLLLTGRNLAGVKIVDSLADNKWHRIDIFIMDRVCMLCDGGGCGSSSSGIIGGVGSSVTSGSGVAGDGVIGSGVVGCVGGSGSYYS